MVTVASRSQMRVVLCWGLSARTLVLVLALGHLRMTEALLCVSVSRQLVPCARLPGFRVLPNFMGGEGKLALPRARRGRHRYENRDVNGPPYVGGELAPLDPLLSFVRVLVPQVPGPIFKSTGKAYSEDLEGVLSPASGATIRDACDVPIGKVPPGPEMCPIAGTGLSRSPGCLCSLMNLQFKSYARPSLRSDTSVHVSWRMNGRWMMEDGPERTDD